MTHYYKYTAIFKTNLIDASPPKVVNDPVKIEFFTRPRSFDVPMQVNRVHAIGRGTPIAQSTALHLETGNYIQITVRIEKYDDVSEAKKFCEDHLDATISYLSILYGTGLFDFQVYRGWLLGSKKYIMEAWVQTKPSVSIDCDLTERLADMSNIVTMNEDTKKRFLLMSKFFSKSLLVQPSEEKFLFLWTMLEIYPMKDSSNIKPISACIANMMNREPEAVKEKLGIGHLFGARSKLVHHGNLNIPLEVFGDALGRLELICLEILRSMSGLPYSGELDRYFNT